MACLTSKNRKPEAEAQYLLAVPVLCEPEDMPSASKHEASGDAHGTRLAGQWDGSPGQRSDTERYSSQHSRYAGHPRGPAPAKTVTSYFGARRHPSIAPSSRRRERARRLPHSSTQDRRRATCRADCRREARREAKRRLRRPPEQEVRRPSQAIPRSGAEISRRGVRAVLRTVTRRALRPFGLVARPHTSWPRSFAARFRV